MVLNAHVSAAVLTAIPVAASREVKDKRSAPSAKLIVPTPVIGNAGVPVTTKFLGGLIPPSTVASMDVTEDPPALPGKVLHRPALVTVLLSINHMILAVRHLFYESIHPCCLLNLDQMRRSYLL